MSGLYCGSDARSPLDHLVGGWRLVGVWGVGTDVVIPNFDFVDLQCSSFLLQRSLEFSYRFDVAVPIHSCPAPGKPARKTTSPFRNMLTMTFPTATPAATWIGPEELVCFSNALNSLIYVSEWFITVATSPCRPLTTSGGSEWPMFRHLGRKT